MELEVEQLTDEELAVSGGEGDQAAFTSLYERYFQHIYDFAVRLTRDHDEAADVTQSTFLKAYQSLERRDPNASFKSWLFTIAHHDALDRMRRGRRLVRVGDEDEEGLAVLDPDRMRDPLQAAERSEIGRLVWEAARGLKPREYALLDLYVRQGMDAAEISQITGVRRESVHTTLSRLRSSFEEAFTALILLARGRSACEELAQLAGPSSPKVRQRVMRHLEECETCQKSRRRYLTAAEFLGAMPPVVVLPALQDSILSHVLSHAAPGARDDAPASDDGSRAVETLRRFWLRWRLALSAAAVVVASLLFFGIVMAQHGMGDGGGSGPHDPENIHSTSHEVGVPSQENIVTIVWTPLDDVQGYSVRWSKEPDALPDTTRELPGDADRAWTRLASGNWYFSLRTEGKDGAWTSTAHLGPFMIRGTGATPTITAAPTVTPTSEATPAPTRRRQTLPATVAPRSTPIVIRPATATQPAPPPPPPPTATPRPPTPTHEPPPTPTP